MADLWPDDGPHQHSGSVVGSFGAELAEHAAQPDPYQDGFLLTVRVLRVVEAGLVGCDECGLWHARHLVDGWPRARVIETAVCLTCDVLRRVRAVPRAVMLAQVPVCYRLLITAFLSDDPDRGALCRQVADTLGDHPLAWTGIPALVGVMVYGHGLVPRLLTPGVSLTMGVRRTTIVRRETSKGGVTAKGATRGVEESSMSDEVERRPPYVQVAKIYRDRIVSGDLKDGERLPLIKDMVRIHRVSQSTISKAMRQLHAEELVTSSRAGIVVAAHETTTHSPRDSANAMKRSGKIYPESEWAKVISAAVILAPEYAADALGVDIGAEVIRRERVRMHAQTPVSLSVSWWPGVFAEIPGLLSMDRVTSGAMPLVQAATGRVHTSGRDQLSGGTANEHEAGWLEIPLASAVLRRRNWWFDRDGMCLEFGESTTLRNRWVTYEYEV